MNYAASFDFAPPRADIIAGEAAPLGNTTHADAIIVPDADLLFCGNFSRAGVDLVLSKDGHQHILHDYFKGSTRAPLSSNDGAQLSGELVMALTGEIQVAQAGAAPEPAKVIGQVSKLTGSASAIRNGVSIELHLGDNVHKGDVVQAASNSSLGLTFIDGTVFGLSANARMVLNEMVWDPNGSSNSSLLSLIQGTVSFVAGETAKQGDMRVSTPVATMGIRGTAVLVEIDFAVPGQGDAPPVKFHVLAEPGNVTGSYVLYSNTDPGRALGTVNQAGLMTSVTGSGDVTTGPAPPLSPLALAIVQQTLQLYFPNYVPSGQPRGSTGDGLTPPALPGDDTGLPKFIIDNPLLIPIRFDTPDDSNGASSATIIVTATPHSLPLISVNNVIDDASFSLASRVVITNPGGGSPAFSDLVTPYVAGSAHLAGASAPGGQPPGVDLAALLTVDPGTGAVTYAPAAFRFLGAGDNAVYTIAFDSQSGTNIVHNVVTVTITGANDAPVVAPGTVTTGAIGVAPAPGTGGLPPQAPGLIGGFGGVAGYGALALPPGDDNSSGPIDVTSIFGANGLNFFGHSYTSIYINNNGNITFGGPSGEYTPQPINADFMPMIAAFWADVDTRDGGAVYYHLDPATGTLTVTWDHVGYFDQHNDKLNTFQLQLVSTGNGNFNIIFRYGDIEWTAGDASDGGGGLGGIAARIGYSAGDGVHAFELPQSGNQAALLALEDVAGNTGTIGVSGFQVINGEVQHDVLTTTGAIDFADPDIGDVHTAHVVLTGSEIGTLTLVKVADTTGTGTGGKFAWTYQVDSAAAHTALAASPDGSLVQTFQVVIDDGHGGTLTQSVNVTLSADSASPPQVAPAPTLVTTDISGDFVDPGNTQHTLLGLHVTDPGAPDALFTISLSNEHGVLTKIDGSPLPSGPLSLPAINTLLDSGLLYTFANGADVENVTLKITDQHGASDQVNFVFRLGQGSSQTPLVGTPDKDVIIASAHSETLTGGAGADQFVFAAHSGADTITDFTPGVDRINLQMPAPFAPNETAFAAWLGSHATTSGADTLLHIAPGSGSAAPDTILLKNVSLASLHVGDFIVH